MRKDHIERSLVVIKSDGLKRGLVGKIIGRFEDAGLKIVAMKMKQVDLEFAKKHYREDIAERYGEHAREIIMKYLISAPVIAIALEGISAIEIIRKMVGSTVPKDAAPGTIRGDFQHMTREYAADPDVDMVVKNLIHASGNREDAAIELPLWFSKDDFFEYQTVNELEIYQ